MLRPIRIAALAVALGAAVAPAAGSQTMDATLTEPAAVPLDFLAWIDRDTAWLEQTLRADGVTGRATISGEVLESDNVALLKAVNRVRGFAHLAAPGLRPPYFDLTLEADGGGFRCVTLFPESIVPGIGAGDFARASFPAAGADPTILGLCRVPDPIAGEYRGLARDAFRERYFTPAGDLRSEFSALNDDPGFIATAFDHGFFVAQGDLTGRVRISE